MAQYKGFTFDGINSADYGVVITGASTYSAPERAVEMFDIPGRNGALAIDQGRFANIEITYHCAMADRNQATFAQRLSALRNHLCSRYSYVRLTDDYNADEYRLALYKSGLDADLVIDRGGEFDVVFDCKPQRFLTSGESTYQIGEWGQTITETGDIVTYQGDDLTAVKSLTTALEPIQDLHGYDSPWPAGGGKNLIPPFKVTSGSGAGLTMTPNDDGTIRIHGTATNTSSTLISQKTVSITLPAGTYTFYHGISDLYNKIYCQIVTSGYNFFSRYAKDTYTIANEFTITRLDIGVNAADGEAIDVTIKPQLELGSTATSYSPYSNICPIYGRTGQTVTVAGEDLLTDATDWTSGYFISASGEISPDFRYKYTTDLIPIDPSTSYYISYNKTNGTESTAVTIAYYDASGAFLSRAVAIASTYDTGVMSAFVTSVANAHNCRVSLHRQGIDQVLARGITYTREFEDSQGNTLTVYGGEDEIVGGVLTVERTIYNPTGSEANYSAQSNNRIAFVLPNTYRKPDTHTVICSDFGTVVQSGTYCYVTTDMTVDELKAYFANNTVQMVLYYATPQTYQLSANEVETLIGTNHVWSDAGDVTVEYGTDPYTMVNDTQFASKPLIKVTGYGEVGFGDITITITGTAGVVTYIDCDLMECYRMSGGAIVPANQYVTFTGTDFPTIPTGKTRVTSASTISKVEVVPRWWII